MYININSLEKGLLKYGDEGPFDHCVIDNFFKEEIAEALEKEFPDYRSDIWHKYDNPLEIKKVCNNWNVFPAITYKVFNFLNSDEFLKTLRRHIFKKTPLFSDIGLNGGGWHIHPKGGKLNSHLDYSIHPKLGMKRKLNLIVYLNKGWKSNWEGNLGFWSNESSKKPGKLIKEIEPLFNRAILFDTTQNSWHGLSSSLKCPKNKFRKSLSVYYLTLPTGKESMRGKALFYPSKNQVNDKKILELIKRRSKVNKAHDTYVED